MYMTTANIMFFEDNACLIKLLIEVILPRFLLEGKNIF